MSLLIDNNLRNDGSAAAEKALSFHFGRPQLLRRTASLALSSQRQSGIPAPICTPPTQRLGGFSDMKSNPPFRTARPRSVMLSISVQGGRELPSGPAPARRSEHRALPPSPLPTPHP